MKLARTTDESVSDAMPRNPMSSALWRVPQSQYIDKVVDIPESGKW